MNRPYYDMATYRFPRTTAEAFGDERAGWLEHHRRPSDRFRGVSSIALVLLASLFLVGMLAACGGGGSAGSPGASYFDSGGLRWSTPSDMQLGNSAARAYCTQQTCDAGGCRYTNFNGEPGWRLPAMTELQALYARTPRPAWGRVWSEQGATLDFSTGTQGGGGSGAVAHATCVRPT